MAQVSVHRPRFPRGPVAAALAGARGGAGIPHRVGQALAGRVPVRGLLPEDRRPRERTVTSSDTVLWGLDGAVAIITLNRPRAKPAATRSRGPRPTGGSGGCPRAHAAPGAAPWSISAQARTICSPTSTRSVGTCSDRRPSGHRHQIALSRHHTVSPHRTES